MCSSIMYLTYKLDVQTSVRFIPVVVTKIRQSRLYVLIWHPLKNLVDSSGQSGARTLEEKQTGITEQDCQLSKGDDKSSKVPDGQCV